jgi:DNA-binding transcriptional regulator YdaS (Cro superfamily)
VTSRERKFFLELLEIDYSETAKQIGCSPSELSQCLSGKRKYPEIRKALVKIVRQRIAEKQLFGNDAAMSGLRQMEA